MSDSQLLPHAWPFPYLVVRVTHGVYAIAPLPKDLSREQALAFTEREYATSEKRFRMCLVYAADDAVFFEADGSRNSGERPSGGVMMPWKLKAPLPGVAMH